MPLPPRLTAEEFSMLKGAPGSASPFDVERLVAEVENYRTLSEPALCRHGWRGTKAPKISDACPACGSTSLFVGDGGGITCAVIGCGSPGTFRYVGDVFSLYRRMQRSLRIAADYIRILDAATLASGNRAAALITTEIILPRLDGDAGDAEKLLEGAE